MVVDVNNRTARMELPVERLYLGPASVIKRLLAFMMDLVILNVLVLLPFNGLIERIIPSLGIGALAPTLSLLLLLYGLSIVIFLYFVFNRSF